MDVSIAATQPACDLAAGFKRGGGRILHGWYMYDTKAQREAFLSYTDIIGHTNQV